VALAAAQRDRSGGETGVGRRHTEVVQSADWTHAMPLRCWNNSRSIRAGLCATLDRFLSLQMAAGEDRGVLRRLRDEMFRHGEPPAAALHEGLRLLREEDRRAALSGIAVPTLVVHGERDRIVPVGAARFLAAQLPNAQLELVPGAGHAPFLSHTLYFWKS